MTLTAVSLFAGIEGIGLALHRVGVEVTAAVEIDDAARGVIADRMPDTTLLTDVTKVTADDLRATGFDPDRGIVGAGWPCQGNSVAGRRGGMADPRSGLWVHVVRLLAELRPRWFLGENVPGLLSVNGGRDFAAVIGDLAGLGYGYAWRVLDAQHFGVPQRRRRVFVVGRVGDRAAPVRVLLEPEGGGRDSAAGRAQGARVAATLTAGSHGPGSNAPGRRSEDDDNIVVDTLMAGSDGRGWRVGADEAAGNQLVVVPMAYNVTPQGHRRPGGWGGFSDAGVSATPTDRTATIDRQAGSTRLVESTAVRRLTPLECERLQGFPDGWTATSSGKPQSDSARYRQIGNAVAVPCVEWIARRIVHADALIRAGP